MLLLTFSQKSASKDDDEVRTGRSSKAKQVGVPSRAEGSTLVLSYLNECR